MPDTEAADSKTRSLEPNEALRFAMLSLETSTDPVFWFDASLRIVYANQAACRSLGYSNAEMARFTIADINPTYGAVAEKRAGVVATDLDALTGLAPWTKALLVGTSAQTYETIHRHRDGRLIPIAVTAAPLDVAGHRYFVAVTRDLSSQRWMESTIQSLTGELRHVFSVTLEMLCVTDANGIFHRLNPAWERAVGFSTTELVAGSLFDFVHPDDRESTRDALRHVRGQDGVVSFTNRFRKNDGEYCWLQWRCVPDGERIYAAAHDMSARAAAEDALRLAKEAAETTSRAKSQFLVSLSHEIRTPLNAIFGMTHLALKTPLTDQQRDYLTKVQEATQELTRQVSGAVDFAENSPDGPGAAESPAAPRPPHVLLVEDNRLNQRVAREMLQHLGIVVEVASNGREALDAVRRGPSRFDAILMDMQMPEMDGLQATRAIRAEFPRHPVPIIAATANALRSEKAACLEAGMNDHVSKPIDPAELERTLARWVSLPAVAPPAQAVPAAVPDAAVAAPSAPAPAAQAPAQSDPPPPDTAPLPPPVGVSSLRGVDVDAALARLNGRRDLLRRLLRAFVEDHEKSAEAISNAIAKGDFDLGVRIAHEVKGVAGTLAANTVFDAARVLEQGLRSGRRDSLPPLVDRLATALEVVCRSVAELSGESEVPGAPTQQPPPGCCTIGPLLVEFDTLLKNRRFSARQHFNRWKDQVKDPAAAAVVEQIQQSLDRLDFQHARELVAGLVGRLSAPQGRA